ncbi:MAG: hypothetical protein MZU84_07550 [Sphingobacterium sp.]|nr:hypothetical protein [Sphingobacterium sp.]
MIKNNIPTARHQTFIREQYESAKSYIVNHALPVVLKADGLAAGKELLFVLKGNRR